MTVDDLMPHYLAHLREESRSPRTMRDYQRTILAVDRELPYGADIATEDELRAWLWREGLQPSSRAVYHAALRSFYHWAANTAGAITFDPSANIKRPRVPKGLPRVALSEQVETVVTRARDPYRLWATLAAYAGLRCIEIYRLHREHVTQEGIRIYRGKGDKAREIPTHPAIWRAVKDLPPGPLVDVTDERRLSLNFLTYCQDQLGMRGMSMHRIRGWFATVTYAKTKDLRGLQITLGHANPATTAGYVAVANDQLQAIIAAVPDFGAAADAPETGEQAGESH